MQGGNFIEKKRITIGIKIKFQTFWNRISSVMVGVDASIAVDRGL